MSTINLAAPHSSELPRAPLPRVDPCTIIIFGASGDLARRKLLPALFNLACEGCTGPEFKVLGVGRTEMTDAEFQNQMHEAVATASDTRDFTEERWTQFAPRLSYIIGDPNEDGIHDEIAARLEKINAGSPRQNRLFYLSTPPSVAKQIIEGLGAAGLTNEDHGWSRVVVEKPFGRDLKSAQDLNETVGRVFSEHQVYRIDHFLGKETVQNLLVFRFGNALFEPIWNRNYVDFVEITAAETLGVGSRAAFYEETGALRDMIANHLLQVLSLTAMEPPIAFDANAVREKKVELLRSIQPMTGAEVRQRTVRAQYTSGRIDNKLVPGYRDEEKVARESQVETFAAVQFQIDNWRWAGVPFYVRTGKRLGSKLTEIAVHLKRTPQALFAHPREDGSDGVHDVEPNVIVVQIQPREAIRISFAAKLPGLEMELGTVDLAFDYESVFHRLSTDAYETLLLDVMQGDATLFTRRDEVEAQWRLITPIEEAWASAADSPALAFYAAGSNGPAEAEALLQRAGHAWRPLDQNKAGIPVHLPRAANS
jgi:glucose-6-phosphate 1-dehydrogenase